MKFFATGIVATRIVATGIVATGIVATTTIAIIYHYKYKYKYKYQYQKSILNNNSINQDEKQECHPIKKNITITRDQSTQTSISLDRDEGILVKETMLNHNDENKWYDIID
jgi:hypothetical protein